MPTSTTVFVGGAIASDVVALLHSAHGWAGVCWFGAALPLLGLAVWTARLRPSPAALTDLSHPGGTMDPCPTCA